MQPDQQQRIMGYFIEEAKDHLNTIEQGLLNLQSTIADQEMVNEVFRAAHSIKGGAAMLGIYSVQRTAHSLEDHFKVLKEAPVKVDQKLEALFLQIFDALKELLEQLQGPFGLTDDAANQTMSNVEPVFAELDQHLQFLVAKTGAATLAQVPTPSVAATASASNQTRQPIRATQEDSSLLLIFQSDVPNQLREMLQLFKQPETQLGSREQLQEICNRLASFGEQFDLSQWCALLEVAQRAIANVENTYRTLAPVVIKDIKQAQDLVLAGRAIEIAACDRLRELLPIELEPLSADADLAWLISSDVLSDDQLTDSSLFGEVEPFGLAAETSIPEESNELVFGSWDIEVASPEETVLPNGLSGDLGAEPLAGHTGPEVGMAELNSLADLFEGEVPDLGTTWQEEEIITDSSAPSVFSAGEPLEFDDASNDFSDLLFEEESPREVASNRAADDLTDLFGDSLLEDNLIEDNLIDTDSLIHSAEANSGLPDADPFSTFADLTEPSSLDDETTATSIPSEVSLEAELDFSSLEFPGLEAEDSAPAQSLDNSLNELDSFLNEIDEQNIVTDTVTDTEADPLALLLADTPELEADLPEVLSDPWENLSPIESDLQATAAPEVATSAGLNEFSSLFDDQPVEVMGSDLGGVGLFGDEAIATESPLEVLAAGEPDFSNLFETTLPSDPDSLEVLVDDTPADSSIEELMASSATDPSIEELVDDVVADLSTNDWATATAPESTAEELTLSDTSDDSLDDSLAAIAALDSEPGAIETSTPNLGESSMPDPWNEANLQDENNLWNEAWQAAPATPATDEVNSFVEATNGDLADLAEAIALPEVPEASSTPDDLPPFDFNTFEDSPFSFEQSGGGLDTLFEENFQPFTETTTESNDVTEPFILETNEIEDWAVLNVEAPVESSVDSDLHTPNSDIGLEVPEALVDSLDAFDNLFPEPTAPVSASELEVESGLDFEASGLFVLESSLPLEPTETWHQASSEDELNLNNSTESFIPEFSEADVALEGFVELDNLAILLDSEINPSTPTASEGLSSDTSRVLEFHSEAAQPTQAEAFDDLDDLLSASTDQTTSPDADSLFDETDAGLEFLSNNVAADSDLTDFDTLLSSSPTESVDTSDSLFGNADSVLEFGFSDAPEGASEASEDVDAWLGETASPGWGSLETTDNLFGEVDTDLSSLSDNPDPTPEASEELDALLEVPETNLFDVDTDLSFRSNDLETTLGVSEDLDTLLGFTPAEADSAFDPTDDLFGETEADLNPLAGNVQESSESDLDALLSEDSTGSSSSLELPEELDALLSPEPIEAFGSPYGDFLEEPSTLDIDLESFNVETQSSDLEDDLFGFDETTTSSNSGLMDESFNLSGVEESLDTSDDLLNSFEFDQLVTENDLPQSSSGLDALNMDGDFADLEALLEAEPNPSTASANLSDLTSETDNSLEDFADLEALLEDASISQVAAIGVDSPSPVGKAADNEFDDLDKLLEDANEKMGGSPAVKTARGPSPRVNMRKPRPGGLEQLMRVPVKHLDNLSNLVGELVVNRNSLEQDQERLRQSLDNLLYQVQQLSDVGQRMQDLYERSLLESSLLASRHGHRSVFQISGSSRNAGESAQVNNTADVEYDPLEMDRFTGFHSLSQEMIELIVRVRESSSDIEFIVDETDQVTRMFRQVTTQLQEGLTRSRMVPFAQMADRLPRAVRDNALKYKKQAALRVEGRETLIDKMILDQLTAPGGPLDHLINNAIAHGIELPEVRQNAGKVPVGQITVSAFHQGNQTVISVSDDGAGVNIERVKMKAIEKGLITPAESRSMSRLDVYELLFHPGFSTKDQADDLAGRGVGMDVVLSSLSLIRGTINTDSTLGKGTTFTIRLPLTLSISKALCCISDRARIAFPMDGVEDMLDIPKERIQTNAEGQACISWRDSMLPLRPLAELLTYNRHLSRGNVYGGNQEDDIVSVVVLRSTGNFLALQVDQVLGEQEIVIKQLEGPVPKPVGVAGATVLGDGRIMPIADVLELIDLSMGRIRREVGGMWEQAGAQLPQDALVAKSEPTVLIVDDSITVRELLSMTFNKVGYRVEQARDGQEAWEKLRAGLPCDIVFCDIEMPRMDGLELLSRIQKDPSLSHLPIAMLTSRGADRHRQMAAQLGASGYFTKPYLEEALLDAAQRMLKGEVLITSNA